MVSPQEQHWTLISSIPQPDVANARDQSRGGIGATLAQASGLAA
jgi:hypothetical protein